MALERVPADIRREGGVSRMVQTLELRVFLQLTHVRQSDPGMIKSIMEAVTIPVMAKIRIGHFVEAQVSTRVPSSHVICLSFRYHRFSNRLVSIISMSLRS